MAVVSRSRLDSTAKSANIILLWGGRSLGRRTRITNRDLDDDLNHNTCGELRGEERKKRRRIRVSHRICIHGS